MHISGFIEPITLIKVSVKRSFPFNVQNLSTDEANFGRSTQGLVRIQKKKVNCPRLLTLRRTGRDGRRPPSRRFFQSLEKIIYSRGLKLSVAFSSFSEGILIWQSYVHHFDVALATIKVSAICLRLCCVDCAQWFHLITARLAGLGGKRAAGLPGYKVGVPGYGVRSPGVWKTQGLENKGCGKHGVWWKTRDLSENTGEPLFRPTMKSKFCYFKLQWKSHSHLGKYPQLFTSTSVNNC